MTTSRTRTRSLGSDSTLLLGARLASTGSTFVVLAVAARYTDARTVGVIGIGMALGSVLASLADAGSSLFVTKFGAESPRSLHFLLAVATRWWLITGPLAIFALVVVAVTGFHGHSSLVTCAALGLILQQWAEMTRAACLALRRVRIVALHALCENLVWAGILCALLASGHKPERAFLYASIAYAISILVGYLICRNILPPSGDVQAEPQTLRMFARELRPYAAFTIFGNLYSRVDTVLLGLLAGSGQLALVGYYFASSRLLAAFDYMPEATGRALLPRLAAERDHHSDPGPVRVLLRTPLLFFVSVSVAIPFALVNGAEPLLGLIYPTVTDEARYLLIALATLLPLRAVGQIAGVSLTALGDQRQRARVVVAALVLLVGIDCVAIPVAGPFGAIAGMASAVILVSFSYVHALRVFLDIRGLLGQAAAAAGLSIFSLAAVELVIRRQSSQISVVVFLLLYALGMAIRWALRRRRVPERVGV
jgi:O-antigen/teichoic acid export membrane protein